MVEMPTLSDLLKAGVHFGHKTSKWHPKMKPYIFGVRDGVHIIDLEKTAQKLKEALEFIEKTAAQNGVILFLGTKIQSRDLIKKYAEKAEMPYINERWIGGMFTNFTTISRLTQKLEKMLSGREKGEFKKYTKKEQLKFDREIAKLEKNIGGIKKIHRMPEAIFIVDVMENKIAVAEARKMKVPIVAIVDTNNNPEKIDYPIPANNDAIHSLELIIGLAADTVIESKKSVKTEIKAK